MIRKSFDLVGVGLNATDTLVMVPEFPSYGGKVRISREVISPGGQVASALAAAQKLGLRTKYIGTVGDDERGRIQMDSLQCTGMNLDDVEIRAGCANQSSYIIVDESTGERTVFWTRPNCLHLTPDQINEANITCAHMLHIDGHDAPAIAKAAQIARDAGMPVSLDVDTIYPGFEAVLPNVDYLIASTEFPQRWTGEPDHFRALTLLQDKYGCKIAAITLGNRGVLARQEGRFLYSPGFAVSALDTTGAGDIFHGAFCYAMLQEFDLTEALEFSNAMAALNCTRMGARGGIATLADIQELRRHGTRVADNEIEQRAQ